MPQREVEVEHAPYHILIHLTLPWDSAAWLCGRSSVRNVQVKRSDMDSVPTPKDNDTHAAHCIIVMKKYEMMYVLTSEMSSSNLSCTNIFSRAWRYHGLTEC